MILLIFTLLVALFVAIFAVQNAAPVAINIFWIVAEVPLVLVILGSVFAGAIIVFLIAIRREFILKRKTTNKTEVQNQVEHEALHNNELIND
jgi:lipopolysaccharide assembly protein A